MAFWNDLSKKVTQVSQDAASKTKNMTDTAKYRSQINDEERKITENYRKIGELYYRLRIVQNVPDIQALVKEIDASNATIYELNRLIQVARGVKTCPNCGAEIITNAAFCVACGFRIPQSASQQMYQQPMQPQQPMYSQQVQQPTQPQPMQQPMQPYSMQQVQQPMQQHPMQQPQQPIQPQQEPAQPQSEQPQPVQQPLQSQPVENETSNVPILEEDPAAVASMESTAASETPKMKACSNCGAPMKENHRFCTICGTPA